MDANKKDKDMTTQTQATATDNPLDQLMELQEKSAPELLKQAQSMGIEVDPAATEAQLIEAISAASSDEEEEAHAPTPGTLISLSSPTVEDKQFMRTVRDAIQQNEQARKFVKAFLTNRDGRPYSRNYPCVEVKKALPRVMNLVKLVPDGSQDEMWNDFKANPDDFETPVLILRGSYRGGQYSGRYVMLYLRRKQGRIAAVTL